jgi:hypothetical protein
MAARSRTHSREAIADMAASTAGAAAAGGFALPAAVASRTHSRSYSTLDQQQQQQWQWQPMQWQLSSEAPPSNNLAGLTGPHTQPQHTTPTAAEAAEAEAAAAAAAAAVAAVMARPASGQLGVAESAEGCVPAGDGLVGCRVETWAPLDNTWCPAAVEVRVITLN